MPRLTSVSRRAGWLAGVVLLLWLGGFVWFVGSSLWVRVDRASPTDAIVVLTGGKMRLETGLELLEAGKAGKLFVSGVNPAVDRDTLLRALGPAAAREACCIVLGHTADNTVGNALETAVWMQQEGYRSLRLVTSWYHMHRSLLEFGRAIWGDFAMAISRLMIPALLLALAPLPATAGTGGPAVWSIAAILMVIAVLLYQLLQCCKDKLTRKD